MKKIALLMKDLFGNALLDYHNGNYTEDIITSTSISGEDVLPLPYLFRSFNEMPKLEQKALKLAKGLVLDVGCGSGSHSLYLQEKGLKVKAIDISKGAVKVAKQRGVLHAETINILDETETFDTILLLMNGTGISGSPSSGKRSIAMIPPMTAKIIMPMVMRQLSMANLTIPSILASRLRKSNFDL